MSDKKSLSINLNPSKNEEPSISKREYSLGRIFSHKLTTASLEELVIKLVMDKDDTNFSKSFLTSHHIICTSCRLLDLLITLYKSPKIRFSASAMGKSLNASIEEINTSNVDPMEEISKHQKDSGVAEGSLATITRHNIADTLKQWIDDFFDFYKNEELLETLTEFIRYRETKKKRSESNNLVLLNETIQKFKEKSSLVNQRHRIYTSNIKPVQKPIFQILSGKLSVEYIAQQVTALEYTLIRDVRPVDLTTHSSQISALHIYANYFKNVRQFFEAEILIQPTYKAMASAIKRAIAIAQHCVVLNNFNTLMEILSALCTPSIICNEKIWDNVDNKVINSFEDLSNQLCAEDNYAAYRKILSTVPNPCVPFLGVHVGDIRFIDEFNQTEILDTYNVNKLRLLAKEIHTLQSLQGNEYNIAVNAEFKVRFEENFYQIRDMKPSLPTTESSQAPDRLKAMRNRYENYYSDSTVLGKNEFSLTLTQLSSHDWSVICSSAKRQVFEPNEIIYEQETKQTNTQVAFLRKGRAYLERSGVLLRTVNAPITIGALDILNAVDTSFAVISESVCEVVFVESRFLVSMLEADSNLALRFFTELSFQIITHIHNTVSLRADVGELTVRPQQLRRSEMLRSNSVMQNENLVVKLTSKPNNSSLCVDPKLLRERQFRKFFDFPDHVVLIKEFKANLASRTLSTGTPGTIFLSQNHLSFYAKIFSHKTKLCVNYNEIIRINKKKGKIVLETRSKKKKMIIRMKEPEDEDFCSFIQNMIESENHTELQAPCNSLESRTSYLEAWREGETTQKSHSLGLTAEDWKLILGGAKRLTARKETVLINQGTTFQRIFQVIRGTCRIERRAKDCTSPTVVASITDNEIFGEISFVQKKGATASVIVDSDETEVFIIEGYYMNRLLQLRPELASRFLHYICSVLQRRLNQNDRFESAEERKVISLINEPLHHSLAKYPVLPATSYEVVKLLDGPVNDEKEEVKNKEQSATDYCCATSISTYPMLPVRNSDPVRYAREGSPICDQYRCCIFPNRTVIAVADGCNWGEPPRNAARAAVNAFTKYLCAHQSEIGDLQYAGGLVLRALSMANAEIFKGIDRETSMVGTTTLLGGLILQLDEMNEASAPTFGFVYVSIGDCKAFHWNSVTGKYSDITASNRAGTLSASDCGGRLGPHNDNLPDLRNLQLGFYACNEGDFIMIVSDGVHDNLDPSHLGFLPKDLGIEADSWSTVPDMEAAEDIKNAQRISLLEKVIQGKIDSAERKLSISSEGSNSVTSTIPPPLQVVNNLTEYCAETVSSSANWMATNPKGRLPKDYRLYPGKMDHTTCVCVKVGKVTPA